MKPSVYITIGNYENSLVVHATINKWQDRKISEKAEIENISSFPVEPPEEDGYRQWVSQVARAGSRAIEDALMNRIYTHTANEPIKWEKVTPDTAVDTSQDR